MSSTSTNPENMRDPEVSDPNQVDSIQVQRDDSVGPYQGYVPKATTDFVHAEQLQKLDAFEPSDSNVNHTATSRPKLLLVVGGIFVVSAIVCIVLALTPASCSMSLCNSRDGSSMTSSSYLFTPLPFSAPLIIILVTLSTAFIALSALSFLLYYTSPDISQGSPISVFAESVRSRAFSFTFYTCISAGVLMIPVFLAIGFLARWKTAVAFLLGSIPTTLSAFLSLSASTRASSNAAIALSKPHKTALSVFSYATRAASITPLSSHALTFAFQVLTYLVLRDVNTLTAFVFGAALTAFVIRVASAIHAPISRALVSNLPLFDDVRSPAADLSTYASAAAAHAAETCVLFAAPVAATAVLGAGVFPYFEDNAYAMCVWNHLKVDVGCMRYTDRFQRVSYAVELCRRQDFYRESGYPELQPRQSNMVFVALPFLLCIQILISMMISSILSIRTQRDPDGKIDQAIEEEEDTTVPKGVQHQDIESGLDQQKQRRKKLGSKENIVRPFFKAMLIDQIVRFALSIVGFIIILVVLLGPSSTFSKANSVILPKYVLAPFNSAGVSNICRTIPAPNNGLPSFSYPRLDFISTTRYVPIDIYSSSLPSPSAFPWYLLACLILGLSCSIIVAIISAYAASPNVSYASILQLDGFDGEFALANGGSAISTILCISIITSTILSCYKIMRTYGVALAAMGAMTSLAPASAVSLAAFIARDAHQLLKTCIGPKKRQVRSIILASGGGNQAAIGWSKGISTSVMTLSATSMVFLVILHTGVYASPTEISGITTSDSPTRHIADPSAGPKADLLDVDVLSGLLFGSIIPFIISCAAVAAASIAVSSAVTTAARREMVRRGWWSWGAESRRGGYDECGEIAAKTSGWGSVGPVGLAAVCAMGGAWAGKDNWIGVVVGCVCGGSVGAFALAVSGSRLHDIDFHKRLQSDLDTEFDKEDDSGHDIEYVSRGQSWIWGSLGEEWLSGCVRVFVLVFAAGGVVSSETDQRANQSSSWWWIIVAAIGCIIVFGTTHYGLWWIVRRLKDDAVFSVEETEPRVNVDVTSTIGEKGPKMNYNNMTNDSMLREMAIRNGAILKPILY